MSSPPASLRSPKRTEPRTRAAPIPKAFGGVVPVLARGGLLILLLLSTGSGLGGKTSGTHLEEPIVGVYPENVSATIGASFTIMVNVTEAGDFNAYEFFLTYDFSVIEARQVSIAGGIFGDNAHPLKLETVTPGEVRVSVVTLGTTFRGSGTLAFIEFLTKSQSTSVLDLTQDQVLLGSTSIVHSTFDGLFSNTDAQPPVAVPGGPYYGVLREPVVMDASQSYDADGLVVKYTWRFGDASSPLQETDPIAEHVFIDTSLTPVFGPFTVTLTVTDNDGVISKAVTTQVTVYRINNPPIARLTYYPSNPAVGDTVEFDASESFDPDIDRLLTFIWAVDGKVEPEATGPGILVIFHVERAFRIDVSPVDIYGDVGTTSVTVTVSGVRDGELIEWEARPDRRHVNLFRDNDRDVTLQALAKNTGTLPTYLLAFFEVYYRTEVGWRLYSVRLSQLQLTNPGDRALLTATLSLNQAGFFEVRTLLVLTAEPGRIPTTFLERASFAMTVV